MTLLLINPNSSPGTTAMMVAMAATEAGPEVVVEGVTARAGPAMLVTPDALDASAAEVVALGLCHPAGCRGVIVGAFGDPGLAMLRERLTVPAAGLGEASMREAAAGGRRFAVATTTPLLAPRIDAMAARLGLGGLYAGTRLTAGDPLALAAEPERMEDALAEVVGLAVRRDGAAAVIIGGGPLSRAAAALAGRCGVPVIAPVAAAVRSLLASG